METADIFTMLGGLVLILGWELAIQLTRLSLLSSMVTDGVFLFSWILVIIGGWLSMVSGVREEGVLIVDGL